MKQIYSISDISELITLATKTARVNTAYDMFCEALEKAILYIRKHIYETIDLTTLAENSCLSKDHFIRLFKKETGITPLKYINQKKIEKAQLILITDETPVKNVAFSLSYDDYSYFNRLFKKTTRLTPQEYRNSYH